MSEFWKIYVLCALVMSVSITGTDLNKHERIISAVAWPLVVYANFVIAIEIDDKQVDESSQNMLQD